MDAVNNPAPKPAGAGAEDQKAAEAHIGQGETLEGGRQIRPDGDPAGDQVQGDQVQADQVQGDKVISILDRLSNIDSCVACAQVSLIDLRDEIKNEIEAIRQQYASEL